MKFTASQIAELLGGEVEGNPEVELDRLSKIEEGEPGSLSFLSNPKYTPYVYDTRASAIIVNKTFTPEKDVDATLIKVDDSYKAFSELLRQYDRAKHAKTGIAKSADVADSVQMGTDVFIGAYTVIGENVKIGNGVKIYPHCVIGDNVSIGGDCVILSNVQIHTGCTIGAKGSIASGCVIGADGFGFSPNEDGSYTKVPQTGNVIIGDHVDIGALTTIDRATLGSTKIHDGVKLDNQIQVAHNVEIGRDTVIASQTGIAGSTKIGRNCRIGGQVGIAGHLTIGDRVQIQAQSGIGRNIKDDERIQGTPAIDYGKFNRSYVYFRNFDKIVKRIDQLEDKDK